MEQVALGVQEALVVQANLNTICPQKRDQVFDELERLGRKCLCLQVALEAAVNRRDGRLFVGFPSAS